MGVVVNTTFMSVGEREFYLVDVKGSQGYIGVTPVTPSATENFGNTLHELFYIADEPIINIIKNNKNDPFADKLLSQVGSIHNCSMSLRGVLGAARDSYSTNPQGLIKSAQPVLELLRDGLYVVHASKMIPTDGAGNFFWNAYSMRHEVYGTGDYNSVIGRESNYNACFLIPSCASSEFNETNVRPYLDKIRTGNQVGGVAIQLCGMFSVLLSGHSAATASIMNDTDFRCILIEPVRDILFDETGRDTNPEKQPVPVALSCPFVKIPIEVVPEDMLTGFLLRRHDKKASNYDTLKAKLKSGRGTARRALPQEIYDKSEALPDCKMLESTHIIQSLSDEQISALLSGETALDGETIISPNYYNSVAIACNYLQYVDFEKFLEFALAIIGSPDLAAVHKYVLERLAGIMNSKIYRYFKALRENPMVDSQEVMPIVSDYIARYDGIADQFQRESYSFNNKKNSKAGPTSISKMEDFIRRKNRSN
ncbi:MAG: hypothetical protein FWH05_09090 [Oscillospiraceae bacterium]|nr:hypothetical protein [Oscillospiraceae bacterium]